MAYTKTVWKDDTRTRKLKMGTADANGFQDLLGVSYGSDGQEGTVVSAAGLNNIENGIAEVDGRVTTLWNALYQDITGNPWTATFGNLTGITVVSGVWNTSAQWLEC